MKKLCSNSNRMWKDEMVRRWKNLVLVYQRMKEHPTFKLVTKVIVEVVKLVVRILLKKLFDFFFDNI